MERHEARKRTRGNEVSAARNQGGRACAVEKKKRREKSANQFGKMLISRHGIGRTTEVKYAFRPAAVLTIFYHFISETAWVLYLAKDPW